VRQASPLALSVVLGVVACLAGAPGEARTPGSSGLEAVAADAFACRPLQGPPGKLRPPRAPKMRSHRLEALRVTLPLPASWKAPLAPTPFAADASSKDERTTVRVVVEKRGGIKLADAIARHEGRSFGQSSASDACGAALLDRYGKGGDGASVGVYRSRYPYRGYTTTYVLYLLRGDELVVVSVETRWSRRKPPELGVVDAVLSGVDVGRAVATVF
jgi:hypothetical protein